MAPIRKKLVALDSDDLSVISAHCQDAVLKAGNLVYEPDKKRLLVELNRYVGESQKERERRLSVLHIEKVESVQTKRIDPKNKDQVFSLLAILFKPENYPSGQIDLVFSGDAVLRLSVECIEARLIDLDASWKASSQPRHPDV